MFQVLVESAVEELPNLIQFHQDLKQLTLALMIGKCGLPGQAFRLLIKMIHIIIFKRRSTTHKENDSDLEAFGCYNSTVFFRRMTLIWRRFCLPSQLKEKGQFSSHPALMTPRCLIL